MKIKSIPGAIYFLLAMWSTPAVAHDPLTASSCESLFSETTMLSSEEVSSIKNYIYLGYGIMNSRLRSSLYSLFKSPQVELLNQAISKLPIRKGVVFRGAYLSKRAFKRYRVGKRYVEPAFLSASTQPTIIDVYSNPLYVPRFFRQKDDISVAFVIQSVSGREIDNEKFGGTEHEVIFRPRTTFFINSIERTELGYTISMSEDAK